jgi:hypothetical protein
VLIVDSVCRWWRGASSPAPGSQRVPALSRAAAAAVWTTVAAATLTGAVGGGLSVLLAGLGVRTALFRIATWGGGAGMAAVLVCGVVWITWISWIAPNQPDPNQPDPAVSGP